MTPNKIVALSPTDIKIQIVPEFLKRSDKDIISVPETDVGYLLPVRKFLVDQIENEVCGLLEVVTLYINDKIRRDLLEELYKDQIHFDVYVRAFNTVDCPKILRIYKDCVFCRQEFIVPELDLNSTVRYYFTNSNEPWQLSEEKISNMVPENQYFYDYAVSKAIKDLKYPLKEICDSLMWQKKLKEMERSGELDKVVDGLLQNVSNH